jgi:hypothetical protein
MATTPATRRTDQTFRWRLDIDTATYPAVQYQQMMGIEDFKPPREPRTVADETYEDQGAYREASTGSAWRVEAKFKFSLNAAGTSRDPVHAFLFDKWTNFCASNNVLAAEFGLQYYDRNGIADEAFEGRAFVKSWVMDGGLGQEVVTVVLQGQGALAAITNPASSQLPGVTGLLPATGDADGGTLVNIYGHHLAGASAVEFGTDDATSYTIVSDSHIVAVSPAHAAGTVQVKVTTTHGVSPNVTADDFVYTA